MRICYLDIRSSYAHSSLALPLLHAACEQDVHAEWCVVGGTIKDDVGSLVEETVAAEPDVVLSTVYLFNRDVVLRMLRRIHALRPGCVILLGGPEFLGDNERFLEQERCATAVFRGEGETALPRILLSLDDRALWRDIPGLCWIDAEGQYRDNGIAQVDGETWRRLPPPTSSAFVDWSKPFIQLETARGCPHRCTFCTSCRSGRVRWLGLDRARDVLHEARRHGVREIRVLDRTFNAVPERAGERLRLFLEEFGDLRFHLEMHPAFLTDAIRDILASAPAGRLHLEVGLQTTHPGALIACGRTGTPEVIREGLQFLCRCRNLDVHVDLLGGLPQLPLDHLLHDLAEISRLKPQEIQLEILKILPGTPVSEHAAEYGLVYAPDPPYEVLRTPEMSVSDLRTVAYLSRLVDCYYNHPILQPAVVAAVEERPDFYVSFLAFLERETDPGVVPGLERRALLLHRYLAELSVDLAGLVEYGWMLAGMSPDKGPGKARRCRGGIPDSAVSVMGCDSYRDGRGRVWLLERRGVRNWFVYDRSLDLSRPVAVYQLDEYR